MTTQTRIKTSMFWHINGSTSIADNTNKNGAEIIGFDWQPSYILIPLLENKLFFNYSIKIHFKDIFCKFMIIRCWVWKIFNIGFFLFCSQHFGHGLWEVMSPHKLTVNIVICYESYLLFVMNLLCYLGVKKTSYFGKFKALIRMGHQLIWYHKRFLSFLEF